MASRTGHVWNLPAPVTKRTSQSLACANGRKVTNVCPFPRIPSLGGGSRFENRIRRRVAVESDVESDDYHLYVESDDSPFP